MGMSAWNVLTDLITWLNEQGNIVITVNVTYFLLGEQEHRAAVEVEKLAKL